MQILIPMSGSGERFRRAGYDLPKPLLEVDGVPMIEHVVRMFPGEEELLFVCARPHLEQTPLQSVLERLAPQSTIVGIEPHRLGPVYAALQAAPYIKDDEPVILSYCDITVDWDYASFKRKMEELNCAGAVPGYRGFHPHCLGPNLYAYMRERDNYLIEIQEKHSFTDQPMSEYASAGIYYFQSGAMLKQYFCRAIEQDLRTTGEYYSSMPYNLMVADGLDVYVYDLEHFLHWGTPRELEAYQAWSNYFAFFPDWKPALPSAAGTNLIPMAGAGARFANEGYLQPKPLIPIAGVPMIQRSLATLPPADNCIAVCCRDHAQDPAFELALRGADCEIQTLFVDTLTQGQACTCLLARDQLDPTAPLLIGPCDAVTVYDEVAHAAVTTDPEVDCLVWTFRNHPHANRNPQQYGWARTTADGEVLGISCKVPISDDVRRDPGIIGVFWFREARFFLEAVDALIAENRRANNEFYVDSAVQVLVEQGRRAKIFDVQHYVCLGTPDDVRTYEFWASYFRKAPHHPYGKEKAR